MWINLSLFTLIVILPVSLAGKRKLVQLITITRHGIITPADVYPNDPNADVWMRIGWPEYLTSRGAQQHCQLGHFIQKRYSSLVNDEMKHGRAGFQSTKKPRARIAAHATLSGLLGQDCSNQTWAELCSGGSLHPECVQYPVDDSADYMHKSEWVRCRRLMDLNQRMNVQPKIADFEQNRPFYRHIETISGANITNFDEAKSVYESYLAAKEHGLPLSWVDDGTLGFLYKRYVRDYQLNARTHQQRRLSGGPTLGVLMKLFHQVGRKEKIEDKFTGLFGHTSSFMAITGAMGIRMERLPGFAATLFIEVLESKKDSGWQYHVRFLYKESASTSALQPVTLAGCPDPCPLEMTKRIIQREAIYDYEAECRI